MGGSSMSAPDSAERNDSYRQLESLSGAVFRCRRGSTPDHARGQNAAAQRRTGYASDATMSQASVDFIGAFRGKLQPFFSTDFLHLSRSALIFTAKRSRGATASNTDRVGVLQQRR